MNFLAHIYLSGEDDMVKLGNFMADGIRGKDYTLMPDGIKKGVLLHREIDTFTDAHPIFRQSTKKLHQRYHHYAGVIVDVVYDHFLAKNWAEYYEEPLESYVSRFYKLLHDNYNLLTVKTQSILPVMVQHNWLLSYRDIDGLSAILTQMDGRTNYRSQMRHSTDELQQYYGDFEAEFRAFFEELRYFVAQRLLAD